MSATILFTGPDLIPIGQPVKKPRSVKVAVRSKQPSTLTVELPALAEYRAAAQPGNRLTMIRDGRVEVSGPIRYPGIYSRSADGTNNDAAPGLLTVGTVDDTIWLASRLVYPDPTAAADSQPSGTPFYIATGVNAETAMRNLVNLNAGPGALAARRVPNLVLGSVASVGTNVNVHARFDQLSDVLRSVALAGGGLGYRITQVGDDLVFDVYQPVDRTAAVRFSWGLANIRSLLYQPQAPTGTVAIVGGDGTAGSRAVAEREDAAATDLWGRYEGPFVNGPASTDGTTLAQAGDEALANTAEQATLNVQAIDSKLVRYGRDYNVDDFVTVEVWEGFSLPAPVLGADISIDGDGGELVVIQIGTATATTDPTYVRMLRQLISRVGKLERT